MNRENIIFIIGSLLALAILVFIVSYDRGQTAAMNAQLKCEADHNLLMVDGIKCENEFWKH